MQAVLMAGDKQAVGQGPGGPACSLRRRPGRPVLASLSLRGSWCSCDTCRHPAPPSTEGVTLDRTPSPTPHVTLRVCLQRCQAVALAVVQKSSLPRFLKITARDTND